MLHLSRVLLLTLAKHQRIKGGTRNTASKICKLAAADLRRSTRIWMKSVERHTDKGNRLSHMLWEKRGTISWRITLCRVLHEETVTGLNLYALHPKSPRRHEWHSHKIQMLTRGNQTLNIEIKTSVCLIVKMIKISPSWAEVPCTKWGIARAEDFHKIQESVIAFEKASQIEMRQLVKVQLPKPTLQKRAPAAPRGGQTTSNSWSTPTEADKTQPRAMATNQDWTSQTGTWSRPTETEGQWPWIFKAAIEIAPLDRLYLRLDPDQSTSSKYLESEILLRNSCRSLLWSAIRITNTTPMSKAIQINLNWMFYLVAAMMLTQPLWI